MGNDGRLALRIDDGLKAAFFAVCEAQAKTPSKVIKQLLRDYVDKAGIDVHNAPQTGAPLPFDIRTEQD